MKRISARLGALAVLAVFATATSASAELIYGIAQIGNATALVKWDSATPNNLISSSFVSGLGQNETIAGIDFRPATGQLYGLGTSSRLYTINTATGAASPVAPAFAPPLNGFSFGFDFNPMIDRIRVVSETNKNVVLNPNGAFQAAGTDVFYAAGDPNVGVDPNVVSSAYDNNFVGTGATQLYGIDSGLNILVKQANSAGTLTTVGPLGVDVSAYGGFDISGATGIAYAAMVPVNASQSNLYIINLATGFAASSGPIDGGLLITALAVANPVPEPATLAMVGSALAAMIGFRRRMV